MRGFWRSFDRVTQRVNVTLSIAWKTILLVVVAVGAVWFGISIYGNVALSRAAVDGSHATALPPWPKTTQPLYAALIKDTGETITSINITSAGTKHTLHSYYDLGAGKWIYHKADLDLDERVFGPVLIQLAR